MSNRVVAVIVFAVAYLVFLIATLPATIVVQQISLPKQLTLNGVSGTVWSSEIASLRYQDIELNGVNASLNPWSLLMLSPTITTEFGGPRFDGPAGKGKVNISSNQLRIEQAQLSLGVNEILPYLPLPIAVDVFGQLNISVEQLVVVDGRCDQASGMVSWQRAAVQAIDKPVDLGDFDGKLSCSGETFSLDIMPNNNLGLTYQATIDGKGDFTGKGYLKPSADFPKSLNDLLPFLGNPDVNGRYDLTL